MLVYRIAHKKYTDYLFAPGLPGRWNGAGRKVLYCAESIPLAFLESMIRRQGVGFNNDFNIIIIEIPDDIARRNIEPVDLADGWRDFRNYDICQQAGNTWFDKFDTLVLKVPSAVVTQCYNYIIHAQHKDYKLITVVGITELVPDARIDDLLREYQRKK